MAGQAAPKWLMILKGSLIMLHALFFLFLWFCFWRLGFPFISNRYKGFAVRGSVMQRFLAGIPAVGMVWEGCSCKWRDGPRI